MTSGLGGDDADRAGRVEPRGEPRQEALALGLGERARGRDAPGEFDPGAAGVHVLPAGAPGAGGVDGEFVRGDGEQRGDAEAALARFLLTMLSHAGEDNLRLARWWRVAIVAALAVAASATGLSNGFAYDDLPMIVDNERIHEWRQLWRLFGETYWTGAFPPDLYRPLTLALFGLQWTLGDGAPWLFHAVSVGLYAAASVATLTLCEHFLSPRAALVGASLFAIHPAHVEAVANVVGQAELLVGLSLISSVNLYVRSRRSEGLTRGAVVGILILYAVALLSKEHAIVLPALLVAVELILWRSGQGWRPMEAARGWGMVRAVALLTVVYLTLRTLVLGRISGVPHDALVGLTHGERIWGAVGLWPETLRLLVWPARLYADYSPQQVTIHRTLGAPHLVPALMLIGVVVLSRQAWRVRAGGMLLALVWIPLTFLLVSNLLFPTGILLAERTLFLPSAGLGLLAGCLFQGIWSRYQRLRGLVVIAAVALVVAGGWQSATRQPTWADSLTVFTTLVADAPTNYRGQSAVGELYLRLGSTERAEAYIARSVTLMPTAPQPRLQYARLLQMTHRCGQALPILAPVLAGFPNTEEAWITQGACLLSLRRFAEGRRLAVAARANGFAPQVFARMRLVADSLLAASDSVDSRNAWVGTGRPFDRTGRDFDVAVFAVDRVATRLSFNGGRVRP